MTFLHRNWAVKSCALICEHIRYSRSRPQIFTLCIFDTTAGFYIFFLLYYIWNFILLYQIKIYYIIISNYKIWCCILSYYINTFEKVSHVLLYNLMKNTVDSQSYFVNFIVRKNSRIFQWAYHDQRWFVFTREMREFIADEEKIFIRAPLIIFLRVQGIN